MNLLKTIIERLNQRVEVANIFDKQFNLCELNANGNDKAWVHYIGNGQAEVVTNFDAKNGTLFWAKRGKVSVAKTDAYRMSGCKQLYVTTFPLTAYAIVRKSHLPCDAEDAQDWLASRVYKLTSGTDPLFKQSIGVINYEVVPSGYANEIKTLTANYEWACVSVDMDVQVITTSEDGCYDTCATGDIPLPDLPACVPCLTEVAVDGVTITGNGTAADPLVAIGGGGGVGTLQQVTDLGNSTTNDIDFIANAGLSFDNGAFFRKGTTDAGNGGAKGTAQICSINYELKWEAGRLYYMQQDGFTIRDVTHNFTFVPQVTDDSTKGFVAGSRWSLDDGTVYLCSDATIGAAVWAVVAVGGVTSVTATAPLASSGGSSPDISITQADASTDGYLSSTDWNTFDGKFDVPTGAGTDYLDGTGTPTPFPTLPTGTVISVSATVPPALSVTVTDPTTTPAIAITAAGLATQYIRGDGQLATLPSNASGGSAVSYYLNGGTPASVATYFQMSQTAVIGTGVDFSLAGNGLINQWLTDANDPNRLEIPAGNWNFEIYMSASSAGGTPAFYVELLKYDGSFTTIANSSAAPENITGGTSIDLYLTSLAIPQTTLLVTDRLALRVYIVNSVGGRTINMHTQDSHLCQVVTNFAGGISALNGLTANTQYLAVGTNGTDFAISSATATHTFNLPTASAANRGALSSSDFITFTAKQDALVSGTNIKTINSTSLLGSGDISIPTMGIYKSATDGAASSGILNTFSQSLLVTANSVAANNILEFKLRGRKTGSLGIYTIRLYANSANNLTGAVLLGVYSGGQTGAFGQQMIRTGAVKNATTNTEIMSVALTNIATDYQNTTFSAIAVDWTTDKYIIGAVQNANAGDSSVISLISMTIL
jgi:hypothetical protein